ncbi:GL17260 [Drosophila persimilis]|uniref:GL17260 n=1 Tax=Drosophila persimilis TaxID=7234 RepID=B4GIS3_DROPE|nr:GL17260 [Drosophila persimilis]
MLSRLLLIFGLLMLSWQWCHTMPRHEQTTHKAVPEHTTARHIHQHTTAKHLHQHTTAKHLHEHTTAKNIHEHTTRKTILGRLTQKSSHGQTTTTPSSVQITPSPIIEQTPGNFSGISGVSLFDLPPNCKPGYVATGPNQRCRLEV